MRFDELVQVMIGAGIGGGARYAVGAFMTQRLGDGFPWHTMAVNVVGSFLIGLLMALSVDRSIVPASARLILGAGVLGGFTTFSTLSYDTVALIERGMTLPALANAGGSVLAGLLAAAAGLAVGRLA